MAAASLFVGPPQAMDFRKSVASEHEVNAMEGCMTIHD
jgi:hypothetical protein